MEVMAVKHIAISVPIEENACCQLQASVSNSDGPRAMSPVTDVAEQVLHAWHDDLLTLLRGFTSEASCQ